MQRPGGDVGQQGADDGEREGEPAAEVREFRGRRRFVRDPGVGGAHDAPQVASDELHRRLPPEDGEVEHTGPEVAQGVPGGDQYGDVRVARQQRTDLGAVHRVVQDDQDPPSARRVGGEDGPVEPGPFPHVLRDVLVGDCEGAEQ